MEFDAAGEYIGLSVLPFCAPEYFAWRLSCGRSFGTIGTAVRIERGSFKALGTPNEINIMALAESIAEPDMIMDSVWEEFLGKFYGLEANDEAFSRHWIVSCPWESWRLEKRRLLKSRTLSREKGIFCN